jgi:hypothetical protein
VDDNAEMPTSYPVHVTFGIRRGYAVAAMGDMNEYVENRLQAFVMPALLQQAS